MDIVTLSGVRKELLLYLDDGPRSLSEIRDRFDITSPEVSPRIKELIEHNLVEFEGKKYQLTPMGKSIVNNFHPFLSTVEVYDQYFEWWEDHDLSSIPDELLFRIGELKNCILIEDDLSDNERTKNELMNIIGSSNNLFGITCTFSDEYPELFLNLAKENIPTHIVLTNKIFNFLEKKYIDQLSQFSNIANSGIYISKDNIKVSLIVTDKYLYFTMNYKNGKHDLQSNLVSSDPSSIKWGNDLFDYFRVKTTKLQ